MGSFDGGRLNISEKTGPVIFSFVEEYQKFFHLFEVDFDEQYIFKQPISHGPSDDF